MMVVQGLTAAGERQRALRRERVTVLYGDGLTIAAIAGELSASPPTIIKDVNALAAEGRLRKRARGEAIAESVTRWWHSAEGQAEARLRSERLRSGPPVERTCERCGRSFELAAKRARQAPGRFCSDACRLAARGDDLRDDQALGPLRAGRAEWRVRATNAREGFLTLDDVATRLPPELRRTHGALINHIADGGLLATWDSAFRRWLVSEHALTQYIVWLHTHPNGKLRRFARLRWRAGWYLRRHKKTSAFGQLGGRPRGMQLADEEITEIRRMAEARKSERAIAIRMGLSRSTVHRALQRP